MKKVVRCLLITLVGIVAAQGSEVTNETSINQDNTVQVVSKETPIYFYQLPLEERLPHVEFINSFIGEVANDYGSSRCFLTRLINEIPLENWQYIPIFYKSIPVTTKFNESDFCFEYLVKLLTTTRHKSISRGI